MNIFTRVHLKFPAICFSCKQGFERVAWQKEKKEGNMWYEQPICPKCMGMMAGRQTAIARFTGELDCETDYFRDYYDFEARMEE